MPFGLQPIHLVVIVVVALLIFGPRRLPEIGRGVGKAINEFRRGAQEMTEGLKDEISNPNGQQAPNTANSMTPPNHAAYSAAPPAYTAPAAYTAGTADPAATMAPAATATASGNFCPSCGNSNPAEARFCNKCGTQLHA